MRVPGEFHCLGKTGFVRIQSLLEGPQRERMRRRRLPTIRKAPQNTW